MKRVFALPGFLINETEQRFSRCYPLVVFIEPGTIPSTTKQKETPQRQLEGF